MNSAQIHLALTHVPVILSLAGLVMLVIAVIKKNASLIRTAYSFLAIAALVAIPVYLTGENAEEVVERMPGVSEAIIERHEQVALWGLVFIIATGLMALIGLLVSRTLVASTIKVVVLFLALASGGLMVQTAHLGGQIRHSEIRSNTVAQTENRIEETTNQEMENTKADEREE